MTEETKGMADVTQPEEVKEETPASNLPTGDEAPVANDDPPTAIGDEPDVTKVDPTFLGTVEDAEKEAILALQQKHQQTVFQLGNIVLQIFENVNRVGGIEDEIQNTYQTIGKRLNIGPKTRWSVMQDGSVRLLPDLPNPQAVPSQAPPPEGKKSEE